MSELEDRINSVLSNPEELERITKLAQSLMGGREGAGKGQSVQSEVPPADSKLPDGLLPGLDMEMLGRMGRLLGSAGEADSREQALLTAMKPFLSEKRRDKMDRAMKLAKLAKFAGFAMGEMGSEDDA